MSKVREDSPSHNKSISKYAVLGNPVKHSLSPKIHQLFASQFDILLEYQAIEVEILDFEKTVKSFFEKGDGLNITIPFKLRAFILSQLSDRWSNLANSANTLCLVKNKIKAFNTDGIGLVSDLEHHQITLENKNILIIGAGGATRGILMPLVAKNPKSITITNRSEQNAIALVNDFKNQYDFSVTSFNQLKGNFDIIINATSLSLLNDVPAINCSFYQDSICYDLVYQLKNDTAFKRISKKYGARQSLDGLGMLVWQAAYSFKIWHGTMPDVKSVLFNLQEKIINNSTPKK